MPKLNDPSVDTQKIDGASFSYSATGIQHLGATEYTLATIAVDTSSSVSGFKSELENAIKITIQALKNNDRADNLLVRLISFNSKVEEIHGFKLLENCFPDDYDNCLKVGGATRLYDATFDAIKSTDDWGKKLYDQDLDVNAILYVITDGCDYTSSNTVFTIKELLKDVKYEEKLESLETFLIGVGTEDNSHVQNKLASFQDKAGLTEYMDVKDASPEALAKLGGWVSQSIVVQSNSLGTGTSGDQVSLEI